MGNLGGPKDGIRWLWATAVVLAAVFFFYPLILDIPLVDPDEGFHASVAQEMAERGDWSTPRFLGEPFLDKPVLYTWTQAISLKLFGMQHAAVRLPGLLFGLLGMITTGAVAWRLFGPKVGLLGAILYATLILPTALAQCAAHDVALVPWVNLAILLFWEADRAASRTAQIGLTLAIGVLLGLSCLTKGFMGVALVGTAYGSYLLVTRRLSTGACLRGACALMVGALVASGWYLAMELRNPGYLYYYFIERHVLGLATSTQKHGQQPWWYYIPILAGGGLPWIIYLPAGLRDWWAARGRDSSPPTVESRRGAIPLLLCWLVGCLLLLSIAGSKLVTYVWPVFPAMAILAAVVWARIIEGDLSAPARRWLAGNFCLTCATGPLVLPMGMLLVQEILDIRFSGPAWALGIVAGLSSWVPLVFWARRRTCAALSWGTLSMAAQFSVGLGLIGPTAARDHSAVDLAQHFNRSGRVPSRVVVVEDRIGSLVFYLEPELRAQLQANQLEAVRAYEVPGLPAMRSGTVVALAERRAEEASRYVDPDASGYQRAGRYRLYTPEQLKVLQRTAAGRNDTQREHSSESYAARDGFSRPSGSAAPHLL